MFDETTPVNFARPMPNWQPLVEYRRNGVAENTIHGTVSWVTGRKVLHSFGGPNDGRNPSGSLLLANGLFYGMTGVGPGFGNGGTKKGLVVHAQP